MAKFTEIVTAAGLSVLLLSSEAVAQQTDFKTVAANRVSISAPDGRVLFNQAATAAAPVARARPLPGAPATSTNAAPTALARGTSLTNVEDCLSISTTFVQQTTATQQAGNRASRTSGSSTPSATQGTGQSYMATCFNTVDGKEVPVAKITFSGTNAPVVELIPLEPGK